MTKTTWGAAAAAVCLLCLPAARAGNLEPAGINLGNTSFFDGFSSTTPGWAYLAYFQYGRYSHITDDSGKDSGGFTRPRIATTVLVNQLAYTTGQTFFDGTAHLGFNALLPVAHLDASFNANSPTRLGTRSGVGDLTLATTLQFDPVIREGRPVFSQRFELGLIAPTGRYSTSADINPGAHFWSLVPNWAATWLPTPRTEVSWRLNYLYNFVNDKPANLPPSVSRTQAGQAAWLNFTASYAVLPNLNVGLNGYYFQQLTRDRYRYADGSIDNGQDFGDTGKVRLFAIGPGLSWKAGQGNVLNVNLYVQTQARNRNRGNVLNVNWIHPL